MNWKDNKCAMSVLSDEPNALAPEIQCISRVVPVYVNKTRDEKMMVSQIKCVRAMSPHPAQLTCQVAIENTNLIHLSLSPLSG